MVILVLLILLGAPICNIMVVLPTVYILITGEPMHTGGITDRLLDPSRKFVGRARGGLAPGGAEI